VRPIYCYFLIFQCLIFSVVGKANDTGQLFIPPKKPALTALIGAHYGFIIPHNPQMTHLIRGHSRGIHFQFLWPTVGDKNWEMRYGKPEQGFDFFFNHTGNFKQLGYQFASSYLVNLPLLRQSKHQDRSYAEFSHWLGLGIGLGYNTKTWDLENNHQADVIGSHINVALTMQYSAKLLTLKASELRAGLRLTHFSNGAFQLPNQGTNNIGAFVMWGWRRQDVHDPNYKKEVDPFSRHWKTSVSLVHGWKEISPPNGKKYPSFTISCLEEYRATYKSSFGVGLDAMYNSSLKKLMQRYDTDQSGVSNGDVFQLGAVLSYGLHFDRMVLRFQQGFYLKSKWTSDGSFYHRVFLRYAVNDHWQLHLGLKTHFAKADHGELGLVYTLK
jgi:hypothetical protein